MEDRELLELAAKPEGWKLVPVEPTQAMNTSGFSAMLKYGKREIHIIYKAMLEAAPEYKEQL